MEEELGETSLTYNETVEAIAQFLEAAFHAILYARHIYPREIFKLHRLYSLPLFRSRHPGLNEYILGLVAAIKQELNTSRLKSVSLLISSVESGLPLERYIFHFEFLLRDISESDRDLAIRDNVSFNEISLYFRSFLMKLAAFEAVLEDIAVLQEDLTFAIVLEMKDDCRPGPQKCDLNQPQEGPWVPYGSFLPTSQSSTAGDGPRSADSDGASAQPMWSGGEEAGVLLIKSLDSGVINLHLHIEDNPARKASLKSKRSSGKTMPSLFARSGRPCNEEVPDSETAVRAAERQNEMPAVHSGSRRCGTSDTRNLKHRVGEGEQPLSDISGHTLKPDREDIVGSSRKDQLGSADSLERIGQGHTTPGNSSMDPVTLRADTAEEDRSEANSEQENLDDDSSDSVFSGRESSQRTASEHSVTSLDDFAGYGPV